MISTIVLVLIAFGLIFRRQNKVHIACMVLAFVIDLALVLYIEITRHAIESVGVQMTQQTATQSMPSALLGFHVAVSVLTLVLYVAQFRVGYKLLKGHQVTRAFHRRLGYAFVVCRLANYITSFFVVDWVLV